ncbi:MAG: YkgJ family cysteine cluster protein [Deltaproteobacteria bacterium]|nr:YkgJ family cysteine cluster protein [Deltaproteobacteria bacterium]
MISIQDLRETMPNAERLFPRVRSLYLRLPETRCSCDQPGVCCTFLPEMTAVEALQWFQLMQHMPDRILLSTLKRFMESYFTSLARLSHCPFLADGVCSIYEHRPFACRAFGLWSRELGRKRTQQSREEKDTLRGTWKQYGVELPAHVVEFEHDHCDRVTVESDERLNDSDLLYLFREIYDLDQEIGGFREQFEKGYHSDFSFLVTGLALGMKKALLDKLAVTKELLQEGVEVRLRRVMELASPEKLHLDVRASAECDSTSENPPESV